MRAAGRLLGVLVVVGLVSGIAGYVWLSQRVDEPFQGFTGAEQFVVIPPGTGTAEIGRRLVQGGVVRDETTFRLALWMTGRSRSLQAGEYRFARSASAREVVSRLSQGDVYTRRLTFPEGLSIEEMAAIYEAREFGRAEDFVRAARNPSPIRELDPAAADLEGYLFPETYPVPRGMPADRVVQMMVDRFKTVYSEPLRVSAKEQGFTTREVVTLASLVEKETARADERPMVAAVYRNRLRIGMGLQADPTVVYALRQEGRYNGNIRRHDLQMDSPYNTYRHAGLPPGPIAAPGEAALRAALMPAPVPYLYFVSRNDGSHVFAETLAEHNRNVYEYQILYFRRKNGR